MQQGKSTAAVASRRSSGLLVAAVVAGLLAGCGSQTAAVPKHLHLGPLTVRIHLDQTRVPAGDPLSGYATLTNNTARPLVIGGCPGDWLIVGLASARIPFSPAVADDCFGRTKLAPGIHRISITGYTTYSGCGGGPSMHELPCPRFGDPLLPLGTYSVKVITMGLPRGATTVQPAPVQLVNAQTGAASGHESASILIEASGCGWTGSRASSNVPVSVTVARGATIVERASARGLGQFIFPAVPGTRYVVRTSGHRGGEIFTSTGVQSYINLFSHCA